MPSQATPRSPACVRRQPRRRAPLIVIVVPLGSGIGENGNAESKFARPRWYVIRLTPAASLTQTYLIVTVCHLIQSVAPDQRHAYAHRDELRPHRSRAASPARRRIYSISWTADARARRRSGRGSSSPSHAPTMAATAVDTCLDRLMPRWPRRMMQRRMLLPGRTDPLLDQVRRSAPAGSPAALRHVAHPAVGDVPQVRTWGPRGCAIS